MIKEDYKILSMENGDTVYFSRNVVLVDGYLTKGTYAGKLFCEANPSKIYGFICEKPVDILEDEVIKDIIISCNDESLCLEDANRIHVMGAVECYSDEALKRYAEYNVKILRRDGYGEQ